MFLCWLLERIDGRCARVLCIDGRCVLVLTPPAADRGDVRGLSVGAGMRPEPLI